jgi:glucose-1-phosphate cytidylyltransferase
MIKEYFRNYLWNTCDTTLALGQGRAPQFHDRHDEEDWTVTLADTGEDSMTGYRVKQIQRYIPNGGSFLLTYGDGLATIDVNAVIDAHKSSGKICTISAVHPAGRFGALRVEADGRIHTFTEKPQFEDAFVNGGYMVCDYRLFNYLPDDSQVMLERKPMEDLVRDGELHAYKHEGFWQPMDTYQEMQYLNTLWSEDKAPWKVWRNRERHGLR